jgi:hypothetical protein
MKLMTPLMIMQFKKAILAVLNGMEDHVKTGRLVGKGGHLEAMPA